MARITYQIKGLDRWMRATDAKRFIPILRKNMRIASVLNGHVAEAQQRKLITEGKRHFQANAELTRKIKKSSKPLVDQGDLFASITSDLLDDFTTITGVKKTSGVYNIAEVVHNGATIPVTPAMRGLFATLAAASNDVETNTFFSSRASELWQRSPYNWKPLNPGTNYIVIPARPWIRILFGDKKFQRIVERNWMKALEHSFRETAR